MTAGRDTFGKDAAGYAAGRPKYPRELFAWIASQCRGHEAAWDCATGNGQAAIGLSTHFRKILATDFNAEQVRHAAPAENVAYSVCPAESTGFADRSVDLVTVAQALHWFDYTRFWPEVERVSRDGALFCAWGYDWFTSDPTVDRELVAPLCALIEPFWAPEIPILWRGYAQADIRMPFNRIEVPKFEIAVEWTLGEIVAFLGTWSAFRRSQENEAVRAAVKALLNRTRDIVPAGERFPVRMSLKTVAGRIRP